jgi:large subunit ribosomal protein L21
MYAVLKTGGKQYKVAPNDIIMVEKLAADAGTSIEIDEVLMIGDNQTSTVGAPLIEGARVAAEVLEQKRAKKITVFKKKRRQNYRRTIGHRQELTVLRITDILAAGEAKKQPKVTSKAKSAAKEPNESKAEPKAKATPKAKAEPKAKTTPKAKAEPKAKTSPKAEASNTEE